MSFRAEIHDAIDEVTPPAPMLASRVGAYVLAEDRVVRRPRLGTWMRPLRGMAGVLAAALVVMLLAGLVLGGRLWRDWNTNVNRPMPITHTQLKALEDRPLNLPVIEAGAACPISLLDSPAGPGLGPLVYGDGVGPVYAQGTGLRYGTSWGTYILTGYVVRPTFTGLVLIRARDLQTNQMVVFAHNPVNKDYYGAIPSGNVAGKDFVLEHQVLTYTELALQTEKMYREVAAFWPLAGTLQGFPNGSSGCIGFQVDGAGFTEHFVVGY